MDHITLIKETCAKVFEVPEAKVSMETRLMGGMSNYTYVITVDGEKYTFRIPGKNAEKFVDRDVEAYHIDLERPLGLNNETVYLDRDSGIKIAKYIEGEPLHLKKPFDYLKEAADVLHTIHDSGIVSKHPYAPFERLEKYEGHLDQFDYTHEERYYELKATLKAHKPFLDRFEKTFTHGDAQISNFVVREDEIRLMDWEFTGQNDPYYDIACFGNNDFDHAVALLPIYLRRTPRHEDFKRLYLWRTYQCLQWHNVALYKDKIGLSKELAVDFDFVARLYLDKAAALLAKL
ncbi:MAG: phosphotransferase [Bacillota bacterium]